ncbi:MAG: transketolase [Verrucomicrobia bacterium]|nr:MAG: transketolase [Verrucomicrobiota bacterium]
MNLTLAANTIRGLAMDGVQKANSGHPGMPMGCAEFASVLWLKYLKHDPADPQWPDRDRFVLSAGHGSMLLYSMLHLSGYALPIEQLQQFRQWDSKTPGHPEFGHTVGVETTTGPLGAGISNAVGMALAEAMLAAKFNKDGQNVVDHYTYTIMGDGCMMEGISHEACSLAGHLGLNKLIAFYDYNEITIEGKTSLATSDDVRKRFDAYGWNVLEIDGHDAAACEQALAQARTSQEKPTLIIGHTHIGQGSPNKRDSHKAHGEPLGTDEVKATKAALGMPVDKDFFVPDEVRAMFVARAADLAQANATWKQKLAAWKQVNPELAQEWDIHQKRKLPADLAKALPVFDPTKPMATRQASGETLNALAKVLPNLIGGSADLAPSNNTHLKGFADIGKRQFLGRNLHFGVREHGMLGIINGMILHGGWIVYGATFFVFTDYCRPAIRLAALMKIPALYVLTHDSIFVGEDGPTHEPIEHIAALRCMPNVSILRPGDPTETAAAWQLALERTDGPTALLLTRQALPVLDRSKFPAASSIRNGAYTLWQSGQGTPDLILIGSGSEVAITLAAGEQLAAEGANVRVVNMASWDLFEQQTKKYRNDVLPPGCKRRVAVEAGCAMGWEKYVGNTGKVVGIDHFGASAPGKVLAEKFGFTTANIVETAKKLLARK